MNTPSTPTASFPSFHRMLLSLVEWIPWITYLHRLHLDQTLLLRMQDLQQIRCHSLGMGNTTLAFPLVASPRIMSGGFGQHVPPLELVYAVLLLLTWNTPVVIAIRGIVWKNPRF
jgi:hypothetical protein